ncbi:MAG: hypothetical protein J1E01_10845 [Acetatifactor sp.]|nr:hypothetical protein [Acetatifactor sp.]
MPKEIMSEVRESEEFSDKHKTDTQEQCPRRQLRHLGYLLFDISATIRTIG